MRRLDTLVRSNGHADNNSLFLKMDIEGHEWDNLSTVDENVLSRFDQIVAEFHSFQNIRNPAWSDRAERDLQCLNKTNQAIHVHGNNNGSFQIIAGVAVPEVIEPTWARKISYNFEATDEIYPISLDQPHTPAKPDLFLGNFVLE